MNAFRRVVESGRVRFSLRRRTGDLKPERKWPRNVGRVQKIRISAKTCPETGDFPGKFVRVRSQTDSIAALFLAFSGIGGRSAGRYTGFE